jgi:hypothetical protein
MNADPGYGGTARMISEAALTLVDRTNNVAPTTPVKIPTLKGGILTCASGLGMRLVDRLRSSGAMELTVEQVE